MKLAFSTLGCPRWDFNDVFSTAKDLGFDGMEIRGIANQMYAPKIDAFREDKIIDTVAKLKKANFCISMLTSGACIAVHSETENAIKEAEEYIRLASKLDVPYIRVMCTNSPKPDGGDYDLAVVNYKHICEYGKKYGVSPLIETNGMFCDSALLLKFLKEVDSDNSGVLWDVHHPYRFAGESMAETANNLCKYIKYVHIKDSIVENGTTVYKMMGYGNIPVREAFSELKLLKYDGFVSLEWVKRWNMNLEEPGIVFAHFMQYVSQFNLK